MDLDRSTQKLIRRIKAREEDEVFAKCALKLHLKRIWAKVWDISACKKLSYLLMQYASLQAITLAPQCSRIFKVFRFQSTSLRFADVIFVIASVTNKKIKEFGMLIYQLK